jgi:hypothetical protein
MEANVAAGKWRKQLRAGVLLLGGVVIVQVALSGGYVTAVDGSAMSGLPVAVTGPAPLTARLADAAGSRLDLRQEADAAAAERAIDDRDVYGAVLLGAGTTRLLTASSASALAAQALTKLITPFAAGTRGTLTVTDVKPLPPGDPHGTGPAFAAVSWALGGYLGAMLIGRVMGMRSRSRRHLLARLAVLAAYALASAAAVVAVVDAGLGVLTGHPLPLIGLGALFVFAIGCFTSALQSLLRLIGVLLSVLVIILLGNPSAGGGQVPPQMMPAFWRALAGVMPNPAAVTAVRGIESFGGQGIGQPLLVLALWAAVSILVMAVASVVRTGVTEGDKPTDTDLADAAATAIAEGGVA